jgi:hypothetical protein
LNLDHDFLLLAVLERIQDFGEVKFRSKLFMEVDGFIKLIKLYLKSTYILYNGKYYTQITGICIGCRIAPILSKIYLGKVNRQIQVDIDSRGARDLIRLILFVDDYFCLYLRNLDVSWIREKLELYSKSLVFTMELPEQNKLQFLDIRVTDLEEVGICWQYIQRTEKDLLSYHSSHEESIKSGIVTNCIRNACLKSCTHQAVNSCENQIMRLLRAKYPGKFIRFKAQRLANRLASGSTQSQRNIDPDLKTASGTFFHGITNRLKKHSRKFGLRVVGRYPKKLRTLASSLGRPKKVCQKAASTHTKFVNCGEGMVYKIPLSCQAAYIGQSGRCINQRLTEHCKDLEGNTTEGKHLKAHIDECKCTPNFKGTTNIKWLSNWTSREIEEAYQIKRHSETIISEPSIKLTEYEIRTIDDERRFYLPQHV